MKRLSALIGALVLVVGAALPGARAEGPFELPFERIVGFGDSLSDPGNAFALYGLNLSAPFVPVPPPAPYAIGDNHYSNGETWLEQMAAQLGKPLSGKPAFIRGRPYSNYAVGGGRAAPGGDRPGLTEQVGVFLSHNPGSNLRSSLIVIEFGGNDLRDALVAILGTGDPAAGAAVVQQAIESTIANMQRLYAQGARRFLVLAPPNLAITPAIRWQNNPWATFFSNVLSDTYVNGLNAALDGFEATQPDVTIDRLNLAAMLSAVAANPADYGLSNTQDPCLSFGVVIDAVCDDPDAYLFWDILHPTMAVHGILAEAAADLLGVSLPPGLAMTD